MMKHNLPIIIIIIVLALFYVSSSYKPTPTSPQITSSSPAPTNEDFMAEKKLILGPPFATASAAAKQKHAATVKKLAKTGSVLGIKNCQPDPLVLQVKEGSMIEVKNNDNVTHKIMIDEDHSIQLEPNKTTTIPAKFKYGTGDYGYICKDAGLVGFIHVVS